MALVIDVSHSLICMILTQRQVPSHAVTERPVQCFQTSMLLRKKRSKLEYAFAISPAILRQILWSRLDLETTGSAATTGTLELAALALDVWLLCGC